ncbi:MAG: hypothetical protein SF339_28400 [Blastocatellia bacterium]|nr:hypothetical protein [Blastocatellia bacterium]
MAFQVGEALPPCEIVAHNYAADVENRIHSDAGAAEHGFAGGLVPGVGIYAYLTRPIVRALGRDWVARGAMSAKFLKPVYDKERVRVQAVVAGLDPLTFDLQLFGPTGTLCAVGAASADPGPAERAEIDVRDYPHRSEGPSRPATIAAIFRGEVFASRDFSLRMDGEPADFLTDVVDDSPIYAGPDAVCHPAFWLAQANELVMRNISLGMWVHTASSVAHFALARDGEPISLRGHVSDAFEKRGHESITLDIGVFGENERPLLRIDHTAIIRLRGA